MGSIRYRKDRGLWFIDYVAADGRRMRETIGPDKRFAKKVLAQREAEAQLGIHNLPANRTARFADVAADWQKRMRPPRVRSSTWESYQDAIERLLPYFGEKRLGAITRDDVQSFLVSGQLARAHHPKQKKPVEPLSPTTMNYSLNVLRFIFRDAVDRGVVSANPASRVRPLPKSVRPEGQVQYLTPQQVGQLLDAAPEPFRAMYRLTIDAGLRRGEGLALRWRDVNLDRRSIYVRQSRTRQRDGDGYVVIDGPPKTKGSMTTIDGLKKSTVHALMDLPMSNDPKNDYVFRNRDGGPIDPDNLDRIFRRHLKDAGLPDMGFHVLRHTCATMLISAGEHVKAIQHRMRHAEIGTTMDTYGHLLPSAHVGIGDRMEAWEALQKEQQNRVQINRMVWTKFRL